MIADELDELAMRDANGRTFRFDELFGDRTPPPRRIGMRADKARVTNCLMQLSPERQRSPEPRQRQTAGGAAAGANTAYVDGVTNPWDSIDFDVAGGLQQEVGFRTRVDCGLAVKNIAPVSPSRRQLRLLNAGAQADGDREVSSKYSSPEKNADAERKQPSLLKHDSQLQLNYLT